MSGDDAADAEAVKAWLRQLRQDADMTQEELADVMNVDTKTVKNAEHPSKGLPRGMPFYLMLREFGVLVDAPPSGHRTLGDRLGSLEAKFDKKMDELAEVLDRLAGAIARLEDRLGGGGDQRHAGDL